jgi:creatinine amidohydrolase
MQLADMAWPAVQALAPDTPVVIPIAAVEQHGRHLPVMVDSLLLGEVVRRVEPAVHDRVLVTPLLWLGNSHHHLDFAGTLSAGPRTYLDLLADLAENWIRHGFRRIVFLNGHGGNITPGKQAVFEVRQRYRDRRDLLLLCGTYWEFATPHATMPSDLSQLRMEHACEWETSMMLRMAPHLVGDYHQAPTIAAGERFAPAARAWTTRDRSPIGHIGVPSAATAEKGEQLLERFSAGVIAWLEEIIRWDGDRW